MDSSGRAIANVHNGDTFVNGTLTVQDQIFVGDAEGKSEYLDSGNYTNFIISPLGGRWNSLAIKSGTQYRYAKNGNIVQCYIQLTGNIKVNQPFIQLDTTVPALDLFDVVATGTTYCDSSFVLPVGGQVFTCVNTSLTNALGLTRITLTYNSSSPTNNSETFDFFVTLTYKLDLPDEPATAIISGGGGSGGDVRNPMIENLDGGGFNIINVDTLVANNVTAPNVVTNPLNSVLDVNNLGLINVASINGSGGETKFGGDILRDVGEVNNSGTLLIDGNVGLDLNSLSGTVNMLTNVDCKTNQILNSSLVETDTLRAGTGNNITLNSVLDVNNLELINVATIFGSFGETKFGGDRLVDVSEVSNTGDLLLQGSNDAKIQSFGGLMDIPASGFAVFEGITKATILSPLVDLSATLVTSQGDLQMNDNKITSCSELASANGDLIIKGLTTGGTFPANILFEGFAVDLSQCPNGLNMGTHRISDCSQIIGAVSGLRIDGPLVDCKTDLNMSENKIFQLRAIENSFIDMDIKSNVGLAGNLNMETYELKVDDIQSTGNMTIKSGTSLNLLADVGGGGNVTILSPPTGETLIGNLSSHKYVTVGPSERKIIQSADRLEMDNGDGIVETVHIYDDDGFFEESTVNIGGVNYYQLQDNITYVIHGSITLTQGFNYGVNSAIIGQGINTTITFDESANDICGFRSDNQNLFLTSITIVGGGGHFTSSTANVKGLFDFSNFNTGAPAPFYGRNKRCRIQDCQIIAPYSLGKVQGGGTLRILGCFFNGGGAVPASVYTTVGLEVSDGLSFEFCNNKVVLMAGAQQVSTLKMLDFVDATLTPVVLGFNAVIISGNIFHPRNSENGINFANNSRTALGTISSNTFIRTGGTAPLINYEGALILDNYNKSSVINYEVNGNAGVIDVLPTCLCNALTSNNLSSATFIDITYPIGNITALDTTKRFGLKSFVSGVSGGTGNYTTGNYIRDSADPNKYAYILDAKQLLAGTDELILLDFNQTFTSGTNYEEVDKDFVLTGVTSTSFNFGTLNNEIELYYGDKDPADLQVTVSISHSNTTTNDEVQFGLSYDTGSGYVQDTSTIISITNPRATPRTNTSTISTLRRFVKGDLLKLQYRYIDITTSVIENITFSVH